MILDNLTTVNHAAFLNLLKPKVVVYGIHLSPYEIYFIIFNSLLLLCICLCFHLWFIIRYFYTLAKVVWHLRDAILVFLCLVDVFAS